MPAWQREMYANATSGAFDITPLRGQDAVQIAADREACRAALLEPTYTETHAYKAPSVTLWLGESLPGGLVWETLRANRYANCLIERGYEPALRPMKGGPQ